MSADRNSSMLAAALRDALRDAALSVTYHRWPPPGPDPLKALGWWHWREPCDCPDTSFGRNPHCWDCALTPIWAQTIRNLQPRPWTVITESPYTIATIPSPWCARCSTYHPRSAPHWGRGTTQPTTREDHP